MTVETHYGRAFVEALRPLKPGKWLADELGRADRIRAREGMVLRRYLDLHDKRVLDFGCGAGASSVVWAEMGATVIGVEPDAALASAAQLRVADDGMSDSVIIHHVPDTLHLPFPADSFDVCICNAVIEHIAPSTRAGYIREIWRVLRTGGYLYITETPNRLCPYDGHTTQLWGIPWLPLPLARRYAIWRGRAEPQLTEQDLVNMGIRGGTYFGVAAALRDQHFVVVRPAARDEIESTVDLQRRQGAAFRLAKQLYIGTFRLLDRTVCRWADVPVAAFLPDLTFCLQKVAAAPRRRYR